MLATLKAFSCLTTACALHEDVKLGRAPVGKTRPTLPELMILLLHALPDQDTYFRSSRLHYIGSWKARIEALAESVLKGAPAPQPPRRGAQRAVIHCDMDCFFATVAGRKDNQSWLLRHIGGAQHVLQPVDAQPTSLP